MLRNKINKKRAALVAVLTLAVAGTAFAFWTTTGTGSGSGNVGNQSANVTLTGTVGSGLKPGGSTTLDISGYNTGSDPTTVETITPGAITVPAGCDASWFHVTGEDPSSPVELPAGGSAGSQTAIKTATLSMDNAATNQNACKGASISVALATP